MSEEKKNYESVDLSSSESRLLRNVCRCGFMCALSVVMVKSGEMGINSAVKTAKGVTADVTEGRADNGHWVQFIEPKVKEPLKTLGDALKTVGAFGIAGLAGWGLVPKKRREQMSEDAKVLMMAARRELTQE